MDAQESDNATASTTAMPSEPLFTLPDPNDIPFLSDLSDQRNVVQSQKLQGPERDVQTFGEFKTCTTCNVKLNSASQSEMHYAGKMHQKKLKKLMEADESSTDNTAAVPTTIAPPGVALPAKRDEMPHCDVCGITFTASSQAAAHLGGAKHAKKVRQLEQKNLMEKASPETVNDSIETFKNNSFYCKYCDKICTSQTQLEQHTQGSKHKSVVEAAVNAMSNRLVIPPLDNDSNVACYRCTTCNNTMNSEQQYLQHMGSARHRNKLVHPGREATQARHHPYAMNREGAPTVHEEPPQHPNVQ